MYQQLFTRLALLNAGTASEVSQPVSMAGSNAAKVDVVLFALTATNVSFRLQSRNDLENWTNEGSAQTAAVVGFKALTADADISAAYVRLQATLTGTGLAIVSAGVNTSAL